MELAIHPEAGKNYNQRAENLVSRVRSAPENYERKQGPPNPNIHASHKLTPDDIIGEVTFGWTDLFGNVKAKAFNEPGELFGLFDEDYQDLFNRYLIVNKGKIVGSTAGLADKSRIHWNLTNEDLATWLPELQILSSLLAAEKLTDFQKGLLEALILYSKSSLAKTPSDKLVFILTALESIFLKDRGEFIQDAIGLRMAFMQDVSVERRREIIDNVKTVYAIRSSFIHHGHVIDKEKIKALTEFMMTAWLSLAALILLAPKHTTKQEFFDYLENRRLAG